MSAASPAIVVDATRCPLCGGDNRCAVELERATGIAQTPCWCMDVGMNAASRQMLLQRIPEAARGLACVCVCATCMTRLLANPEPSP